MREFVLGIRPIIFGAIAVISLLGSQYLPSIRKWEAHRPKPVAHAALRIVIGYIVVLAASALGALLLSTSRLYFWIDFAVNSLLLGGYLTLVFRGYIKYVSR